MTHRFPVTELETDNLRLRLLTESDLDDNVATCNDPATRQYLTMLPLPYTEQDARDFLTVATVDSWEQGRAQWAIADRVTDRFLGSVGVPRVQESFGCAEVGYVVAPWARGRNVAAEATAEVAEFLFLHDVHRVELQIDRTNIASQRAALAAGFRRDARLRDAISGRDGERQDRIVYSRLPYDPPGPTPRVLPDLPGGELSDGRISLRPFTADDAAAVFAHHSQPDMWATSVPPVPPVWENFEALCRFRAADDWLAGTSARMVIRDVADSAIAGSISLHLGSGPLGEAMLGYGLDRDFRGRGFATAAVRLVAGWAFQELRVRRLVAGTLTDNLASQAVLSRAGFTREGIRRAGLPGADHRRRDDVVWSLLPEEY